MKRDATGKFIRNWNLETKQRVSVCLTNTAWRALDEEAQKRKISRSEVIEQFARSLEGDPSLATKQAEQQRVQLLTAQETEQKVITILESITDAFVAFDRDWCYTYVNRAATQILHRMPEELIGKHVWNEVFPELVGGIAYQEMHRAVAEQVPVSWEEFGEPVQCWLEANAYPSAEGVVVYFRDITERRKAEAEREQFLQTLETERTRFEAILRQMPAGVMIADAASGKLVLANEQAKQIVGYDYEQSLELEEYEPLTPFSAFRPDGQLCTANEYPLARSLQRGEVISNEELELHRHDGSRTFITVNSAPILNHEEQIVAAVVVFQDVTHLKQIEENLRQTEERLQLALSSVQMVAWDLDLRTNQVVCSPNALEVWGVQQGTGEDFFAIIYPEDQPRVIQAAQQALTGEQSYAQEYRVISPDGTMRWINSQGRVYLDETGQAIRMIGVSVDTTERKQIEAEREILRVRSEYLLEQEQIARQEAETERQRLRDILQQLPAMIAIVAGSDLVYEFANSTYLQVTGRTADIIGRSMRNAFPEIEGQIYFDVISQVYRTGESFIQDESPAYWDRNGDGILEEGFFNCVCRAWPDAEGTIQGVLIHNIEVTAQVQARQQIEQLLAELQQKERQQQFLIELNDAIRALQDSKDIMWQVVCATGQHFNVTRCTYGEIDPTQEYVIVERDFYDGVGSRVSSYHIDLFGHQIIAELKQGKTIVVDDVGLDPRTAGVGVAAFDAMQTKSLLCVPLVKAGRFVGLFMLHHISPRHWTEEDVTLMERIAQKTWLAVERSRVEEALRESEAHLQLALQAGRMGTWDWDIQTGAMLWSEGYFTMFGLQPSECKPSYEVWASRVHPDDLAEVEAQLQQAMIGQKEYHHEYRLRWSDGSIHWVEARGQFTYNSEENPKRAIGAVVDITERKQAEQEREQLLAREQTARHQAEVAEQRARFLTEASTVLASSLNYELTLKSVAHLVVPTLADWCVVDILNVHSSLERVATAHVDPAKVEWAAELHRRYPPDLNAPHGIANVLRTGQSESYPEISDEQLVAGGHDEDYLRILREVGLKSVMIVPLIARATILGTISFVSTESGLSYSSDDLALAEELARRAAIALDNARLYHEAQQAQLSAERAADRTACLQAVTAALSESLTPLQVADVIVAQSMAAVGADAALMTLLTEDRTELEIVRAVNYEADLVESWKRFSINASVPLAEAVRTGEPFWATPATVRLDRYPQLTEVYARYSYESWMSLPLLVEGKSVGGMLLSFKQFKELTQDERDFILALTQQCAQAIVRSQLYEAERQARAAAEQANRVKDEFLAVLSHELRSPLNPILGWTKLLRGGRLDATKTEQALETIERNAKLQARLIEDLLDVSRILQGKMALNVAPVNLAATIQAALETVRLAAEAKEIEIQTTLNPISGTVKGDTNRLQQVVWNLVSNAVKFTASGGQVEVRLEQVGRYAQIQVKDTGKGISPEFLPHVFEYFRQEDGTTTRHFGGLGLGLAIVRHLTELHGGTVHADSQGENLGSKFTVRLPLAVVEQELSSVNTPIESVTDLSDVQILVVDDEADMRELATFILMQSGAQVMTAASAAQALTLLSQSIPDLLLCDIGMPEMDGYALIQQIRKWTPEQGGSIPAIALTAYAGESNQQQALAAGFQMHIPKPVEPEVLVKAISSLIAVNDG